MKLKTWIGSGMFVLLTAVLLLPACKKETGGGTGRMEVRMTDAPGNYEGVYIDVQSVQVHSDASGWITMANAHPGIYNLLDLTNGTDTVLATADLPAGNISQIRLVLGENNWLMAEGTSHTMDVPSGSESGLKINVHTNVTANSNNIVLLDFDANKSIVAKGNGDYSLKPVIKAIVREGAGSISGQLAPAVFANIYVVSGTDTFSTAANGAGMFLLQGVPAGTYSLHIEPALPLNPVVIIGVNVMTGHTTSVGVINF